MIFSIAIMLVGCCHTNTVEKQVIRDTTITVAPPQINDTLMAQWDKGYLTGFQLASNQKDTLVIAKVDTLRKKIWVRCNPETLKFTMRDTTVVTKTEIQNIETPFLSKLGLVGVGIAIAGLGLTILRFIKW